MARNVFVKSIIFYFLHNVDWGKLAWCLQSHHKLSCHATTTQDKDMIKNRDKTIGRINV
jgi:hypothetical protein